ncbi:MAG: hypothetical protein P1U64_01370 [Alcanivoracaceae bacterium]|nr:hypothetical protein [Alcanivoracaceae bacterium]
MSTQQATLNHPLHTVTEDDIQRLDDLRTLFSSKPAQARLAAWDWLQELQPTGEHHRLPTLFARGTAPEGPHGDCEGIVMNLYGSLWLTGLDRLVRLGQLLGGIGWAGKTFDDENGTGYNRLTRSTRIPAFLTMPTYRFRRVKGELIGFDFYHALEPSPLPPHQEVRAIKYDAPAHNNPLVLPRTRDELVQIIPGIYLGRATLRSGNSWKVVGYFGLRAPRGDQ